MLIHEMYTVFKENQIGSMKEPLLLGFVINKATDHPAHLQSGQCLCLWLIRKYPI